MGTNTNIRIPPQNIEAEQSLLGALLVDKDAMTKIADIVGAEDFYKDAHGVLFASMLELYERHEPIDLLSVSNILLEKNKLDVVGGRSSIMGLAAVVPNASNIIHYARIVQKKALLRRLNSAASEISELSYEADENVQDVLDKAESRIFAVAQKLLKKLFVPIKEILSEAFDRIDELHRERGKLRGIPTGFGELDNLLAGLQKSDLVVLAARPSVGKTSLALDIARQAGLHGKSSVAIFSMEMAKEQLVDRFICAEAGVDLWKMRTGKLSDRPDSDDFLRIGHAINALSEAKIFIDDTASATILEIKTKARRLQSEHGLDLIVLDYLQLMEGHGRSEGRVQEIAEITRGLKAVARELQVPVLALSQLARAVELVKPAIPKLAHLRESGCLTGDTVIMNAKTGERYTMRGLAEREKQTPIPVYSLDSSWKLVIKPMIKVFSSGKKGVYTMHLQSGRIINASANHPFRLLEGWSALENLRNGDRIAIPRHHTPTSPSCVMTRHELISRKKEYRACYQLHIQGKDEQERFLSRIGCAGERGHCIPQLREALMCIQSNPNKDVIPSRAWRTVITDAKNAAGLSWRDVSERIKMQYCGSTLFKHGIGRQRMLRLADACDSQPLRQLSQSDVYWDEIVEITARGTEDVYDATVEETHNFLANDIIVHNSIEQDADVVMFIYRKSADKNYRFEDLTDEDKNTAEIIIAKHRNGPTGSVRLFWDEKRASFRNLERKRGGFDIFDQSPPPAPSPTPF